VDGEAGQGVDGIGMGRQAGKSLERERVGLMPFDFPTSPSAGQEFTPSGGPTYVFQSPRWLVKTVPSSASVSGTAPSSPVSGQLWWNSTKLDLNVWDGTAWKVVQAVWA
jgi:hypothetical protein